MASKSGRAAKSVTEALHILWEDEFFVAWKKMAAIRETLAKRGNHFNDQELGMALRRAKHLTRRGKLTQYEYIQKYPYAVIAQERAASEKVHARKRK